MRPGAWAGDVAAAWALGAVSDGERAAFEARLALEPGLAREAQAYARVAAMLALAAPPCAPPDALRRRIVGAAAEG
ncbi:MAG: hypothetical protein IT361_18425 [Gemmatimonadaceae bacterium]|nr:hypothetical protein [Gemmatimonadaceae bacterium]